MASSRRYPGTVAKVSHLSGGLRWDGNRTRDFRFNRIVTAVTSRDLVPGVACTCCVKACVAIHPQFTQTAENLGRKEMNR
jgi:hypothetical protein